MADSIKVWQGLEGHAKSVQLWQEQEIKNIAAYMIFKCMSCRDLVRKGDTWQELEQEGNGNRKGKHISHYPNNSPSHSNYYDLTCKLHRDRRSSTGNIPGTRYLTTTRGNRKSNVLLCSRLEPIHSAKRNQKDTERVSTTMAGEGSRNVSANKDLRNAREMYESRTLQRNKRKIIDLEAMV